MPSISTRGDGTTVKFPLPPHSGPVTATVAGASVVITSQTATSVLLAAAPVLDAAVVFSYAALNTNQEADSSPAFDVVAITKSDTTDLSSYSLRGLYVGTGGDVAVVTSASPTAAAVTLKNVAAGSILPIHVVKVMATNTTASDIVGMV